ncbi:glycosyltransferase [Luteimonas sp. RC10]|uniref:glycosyltransferase n=1 Tax=Luteimonas sp. RC10 TaxID=2587035 RepID=UPI00160C6276|nr:glycosyltransferase [Luteimonas sp. RC10]MBB3343335.1 glycosyltransferase involved in cell wall biosynthesis [Luteimonas sp. RC10]
MIGVVVPAHNEEALLGRCLASVRAAAADPRLAGETVHVVVALDRCSDRSADIAAAHGATGLVVCGGNVGSARDAGMRAAIAAGARWLASTDADSVVPPDWLSGQLACGGDAFCGMVAVDDWLDYARDVRDAHDHGHPRRDGHLHVHGANLGLTAEAYLRCGGFPPMAAHEDVALVDALVACGARIARRAAPLVLTSARRSPRARQGFGDYLRALEARVQSVAAFGSGELRPVDPVPVAHGS